MILDSQQIIELSGSDNDHFVRIAHKTVIDHFELYSHLFFDCIGGENHEYMLSYARQRFPSLTGGFGKAVSFDWNKEYGCFEEYAFEHALFLKKLDDYLNYTSGGKKQQKLIENLYRNFEGLRVDLEKYNLSYTNDHLSENNPEKQLMVFITGKCNLNCAYCFSNDLAPKDVSLSAFEVIVNWAASNDISGITLCGGEPTAHKNFNDLLFILKKYGYRTYFASNFTIDNALADHFTKDVISKIFIHLTDYTLENPLLKDILFSNIAHSKQQGIDLTIRTNITNKNPPMDEWFDIMKATNIPYLNVALTFPAKNANNRFIDAESFIEYAPIIKQLIQRAGENGVFLSFAKPIPLCIFDKDTQHFLLSDRRFHPICGIHYEKCTYNVCITPEMNMHPCLGLTGSSLRFDKKMSWGDVNEFCFNTIDTLLSQPLFPGCKACFLYDRKLCQGGCLSYKSIQ